MLHTCYGTPQVLLTDYPDPELVANLSHNVSENSAGDHCSVEVRGGLMFFFHFLFSRK